MHSLKEILSKLRSKSRPDQLSGMARFGIRIEKRLGISMPDLRKIGKEIKKDHQLALDLWETGIPEAQIVAGLIADPEKLTEEQMEDWVSDFNSWDVCDQTCMNLFEKSPFAVKKIKEWFKREEEFVKRAAFALIACIAWHDKEAEDEKFIGFLSIIKQASSDNRNFVRKAVNWALRNIGKRNLALNKLCIKLAKEIQKTDSKSARWIAADAIRELESPAVQKRLNKKK